MVVFHNPDPFSWCLTPPRDLFPLLIRLASHIFLLQKQKKRQALGLINCLLQRSDIPGIFACQRSLITTQVLRGIFASVCSSLSCSAFHLLGFLYHLKRCVIHWLINIITSFHRAFEELGTSVFGRTAPLSGTVTTVAPCNPFLRPVLPVSCTSARQDFRQSRWERVWRCQLPIHAIQSVYVNTSTMMRCQWMIQSELKNNEMPYYHNFPDLDEWFSNSG